MRRPAAALALAFGLLLSGCSSAAKPAPKPAPPDPTEETVTAVTQLLKLDAAQQQKTRELLKQLAERYDAIQAEWAKGGKVEPAKLQASQQRFENEFFAILTPEQRKLFQDARIRMQIQSKFGGRSRS